MSKALQNLTAQMAQVVAQLEQTQNQLEKEKKGNVQLRERVYKLLSQEARRQQEQGRSDSVQFRDLFTNITYNDYLETAISIIKWRNLPKSYGNMLNSKRIESQIAKFGSVVIFPHEYKFQVPGDKAITKREYLCLPFVGVNGFMDCYNEFQLIQPYSASQYLASTQKPVDRNKGYREGDGVYPQLMVNRDCIILTDYYNYGQTNGNTSFTIAAAIQLYCKLIADCEAAKKTNRNWLKIPFIFNTDGTEDGNELNKLIGEVRQMISGIDDNELAIISKYAKNLELLPTGAQFYGEQLTQAIKDYRNDLDEFIGIGHIKNENRARKITAEFTNTSDQYNINITKRLENRNMEIDVAKTLWDDWKDVELDVNLVAYTSAEEADEAEIETKEQVNDDISE